MENNEYPTDQNKERRNSNTEYMSTKCRITKPEPPKPATNPLQFIKVAPCPLFQKAHEQIKKVEEIKREEKEMRTEIEDWQTNLDNWKSSRRKRQEHIIERVVEVKKLTEQEENEKSRRKSKTFNEMMEERSRGRHKFNIPLYEDDSNDLSDYGIGSSSSKTNSIKDVDTDDSSSILDEKDNHTFDLSSTKGNSSTSNQSQSEDETNTTKNEPISVNKNNTFTKTYTSTFSTSLSSNKSKPVSLSKPSIFETNSYQEPKEKQYTYEGAIQDYRSRIQTINSEDSSRFKPKEQTEVFLPKGEIFKRKGLFESNIEISQLETPSSRRLSEDFVNTRSIKDRLKSFEQINDQYPKTVDKSEIQVSVRQRLQSLNKSNETDSTNNNLTRTNINKIYLLNKSNSSNSFESKKSWNSDDRCFSPETELYVNKLNMFNRDLDNLMINKSLDESYAPSISSTELTCISSDREDSGIHTGDVSCSVSQADESVDVEIATNINERLNEDTQFEKDLAQFQADMEKLKPVDKNENIFNQNKKITQGGDIIVMPITKEIIDTTIEFLETCRQDSSENLTPQEPINKNIVMPLPVTKPKPVIYENVDVKKLGPALDFITSDFVLDASFSDFNPPHIEPPKVKPPPPPPLDKPVHDSVKRANSTKRIKKELDIKRSSFLGLDEPSNDEDISLEKPPDLSKYFPNMQKLDKSTEKKFPGGVLSKVESQDSGLDLDKGRLSSDTWCSSVGDSGTPSHERQVSEQTNSITSEEDEITKKEREIIELVEKEEQYRDIVDYLNKEPVNKGFNSEKDSAYEPSLGSEQFDSPCFNTQHSDFLDQDSEVLKVEQELRQLELEELERQRENMLFRESRAKAHLHNRHSLENLADKMYPCYLYENHMDCRKSMPELAIQNASLDYGRSLPTNQSCAYENIRDLEMRGYVQPGALVDGNLGIPVDSRKSMPDLQQVYKKSSPEHQRPLVKQSTRIPLEHRKSMPELQLDMNPLAFKTPKASAIPPKPLRAKEWAIYDQQSSQPVSKQLGVLHRRDKWHHSKSNSEGRNYNQHWLIQEAELRRISDQQKNLVTARHPTRPRNPARITNEMIQPSVQRSEPIYKDDYIQNTFRNHPQSVNHALPTVAYSPPSMPKESQDRILSVSGKKKCSYCGNELGRGAAMIVESLGLFYHMDCFKCCVCHVKLGDGMMGTDVKVRNQKLHCHNCYSSDDGVKFSCV
ncbi:uncharacterized protein LOC114333446 [Diabrotica virgifera virgifera]|uniref:Uncharacterized protein LOC114333446 n=1 Tax=Diabrotica virgifera virgifera TaxID=50390 RepID=A0A6P7G3H3_DIAVI|nr:uncharacterized protein LOC114333446 [Diabrotica virgifera virgifera]XP_028139119.1 uncharacterized protein LOC114333446 [Diabrotica virgifera virgifera]XP_028139120.1 uncharacterized protein LOC114333446 [Diabrotica virgifera virgifera]XP_028139121.1 uncharacterized protein LOC114333446 [Diabrotica virgifera virgifera]XP_050519581.1 uncharacterized protein LOC114333446 [Diabrotica virgifera virgifera]